MKDRKVTIADLTYFGDREPKEANRLIPGFVQEQIERLKTTRDPLQRTLVTNNIREAIGIRMRINPNFPIPPEWAEHVPVTDDRRAKGPIEVRRRPTTNRGR